jgi:hypothetical protein
MKIKLNNKKWLWISNKWITSWFFEFDYSDINKINNLPDLFKIEIWEAKFNCTINSDSPAPIIIETETIKFSCKRWQGKVWISWVQKAYIKLDIFIDDLISGLIRVEEITIL